MEATAQMTSEEIETVQPAGDCDQLESLCAYYRRRTQEGANPLTMLRAYLVDATRQGLDVGGDIEFGDYDNDGTQAPEYQGLTIDAKLAKVKQELAARTFC